MRVALAFVLFAVALRLALHFAGISLPGFTFGFILMGLVVLLAFTSGHLLLGTERNAPLPALFRVGLRSTALFALLYALFMFGFFTWIDTAEFPMRINELVHEAVADGHPEAEARARLESFFNPGKYAMLTFFGLLSLGAVNALFFSFVHHKVLRRYRG